jgi:hypothetical protein
MISESGRRKEKEGVADQTSVAGSAGRRESARKNTGRNEREGAGAAGSSGVGSRAGPDPTNPGVVAGDIWTAVINGWSIVEVETRFPSFPPSTMGGEVVIRSKDV